MKFTRRQANLRLAATSSLALIVGIGAFVGVGAASPKAATPAKPSPLAGARAALAKGNAKKALVDIEAYLKTNPQSPEAQYLAGEASLKAGDAKKAAKYLRTAVRVGKGSAFSQKANALMLKLPKDLQKPRTGAETRMLASMFGISRMRGTADGPVPTVIDFYASWCQPCRSMDKALDKAKQEYGDKISIMKVDIDDPKNEKLVDQYEVSPIPTVVFLNTDGEVVTYTIGYAENNVTDGLKKILSN
jgi:thioredoxin 1